VDYFDYKTEPQLDPGNLNFDIQEFLERSQRQEKQRLEHELERIEEHLDRRDEIHEEALSELESKLDWYLNRLGDLYDWGTGTTGEREKIKSRIAEFYREIREEKQQHWHDRQELEQERREVLRELRELSDLKLAELF
jgi:predicted  nucleic acid-binding Zn-ribbon protein